MAPKNRAIVNAIEKAADGVGQGPQPIPEYFPLFPFLSASLLYYISCLSWTRLASRSCCMFGCHGDPRPLLAALAADQSLQKLGFGQGVGTAAKIFHS